MRFDSGEPAGIGRLRQRVGVTTENGDREAVLGQPERDLASDAAPTAGDQGDCAGVSHYAAPLRRRFDAASTMAERTRDSSSTVSVRSGARSVTE